MQVLFHHLGDHQLFFINPEQTNAPDSVHFCTFIWRPWIFEVEAQDFYGWNKIGNRFTANCKRSGIFLAFIWDLKCGKQIWAEILVNTGKSHSTSKEKSK